MMAPKILARAVPACQSFAVLFACSLILTSFQSAAAQTQLEFAAGSYPSPPNGPTITSQSATVLENTAGTTFVTYTPTISVMASFSPLQTYSNLAGVTPATGLSFGAAVNNGGSNALVSPVFNTMNLISAAPATSFTSNPNGAAGTGIAVATNSAFEFFTSTQPLLNAAASPSGRFYYGDLTLTFSLPVSNPVIHIVGLGGQTAAPSNGLSTELELQTVGVTLSRLSGSTEFNVTANKILNGAATLNSTTGSGAASGSAKAAGANITTLVFKVFLRGDGRGTWGTTTTHGGDQWLLGVSLNKPITVSGTVFNDANGLTDSLINGTGTNAGATLFANLIDGSGNVVKSTAVLATGTYSLTAVGEGNYTVVLSTTAGVQGSAAPPATLPPSWINIGEGTAAAGDGTVNGITAITVGTTTDVTGVNFGVQYNPPDLRLTKSAPATSQAGTSLTYNFTVNNVGAGATLGTITISDSLPPNVTVNSGAAGAVMTSGTSAANWTCNSDAASPQGITCTSTTALPATTGTNTFGFTVNVAGTVTTNLVNQAKVWGGGDPNKVAVTTTGAITACTLASENTAGSAANAGCAYESTPVVNSQAFKSVKLTTDADTSTTLTPGDTLTYTVQYVNRGNTTINNFQITDLLPTGITFAGPQIVTVSGAGTGATANSGYTGGVGAVVSNLLASGATIASGGVITVTIPVTVNTGFIGSVANQTSGSGTEITSAVLSDNAGLTADLPATVTAAPYSLTIPGSSVSQTIAGTIDLTNFTVAALPKLSLVKSVLPLGVQSPGTDLTYKIIFTNSGNVSAQLLVLSDPIPLNTDFKVGSATTTLGTTGLTVVVEYSYDYTAASPGTATWGTTPAPASGGGGAPPGYDRTVKAIRWRATAGNLSQTSPNNMGDVGFTVKIK